MTKRKYKSWKWNLKQNIEYSSVMDTLMFCQHLYVHRDMLKRIYFILGPLQSMCFFTSLFIFIIIDYKLMAVLAQELLPIK